MKKEDVGKLFTTNGEDTWKLVWHGESMELNKASPNAHAYHMRELETTEELTQLVFKPKE